jgi:hypothetical protein
METVAAAPVIPPVVCAMESSYWMISVMVSVAVMAS